MEIHRPAPDEYDYAPQAGGYVAGAPAMADPLAQLAAQREAFARVIASVSEERAGYRYEAGKWSVKELVGHLADTERILSYRLLRIGRGDVTPLPGFEEADYVRSAQTDRRPLSDVIGEWMAVRRSTEALVGGMPPEAWDRRGTANGHAVTARALLYIIVGHVEHHRSILAERYGV